MRYLIRGGRLIDPVNKIDCLMDILVLDGKVKDVGQALADKSAEMIDAKGKIVAPGLIDMHTHLREPGREDEETVLTGTRAAVKGGFTSLACMPNTEETLDNVKTIKKLRAAIKKDALINVFIIGAISEKREGKRLADFKAMKGEGIVAVSDDGSSVEAAEIMQKALKEARNNAIPVIAHCEDIRLSKGGVVNKGFISTKMGLRGISAASEYERVGRDIELAKKDSWRIHIAHVSCKESVELIRNAKKQSVQVTAETAPHYFALTEDCCATYDTNTKMNPPLRTKEDVEAVKLGLKDGTIDAVATDHAPHTDSEKDVEFDFAPFGIIGLETALSLAVSELVDKGIIGWRELISRMSVNPSKILGLGRGSLGKGDIADIVIIDPGKRYVYTEDGIESESKNSPFINWQLKGRAISVLVGGKLVMKDETIMG